MISRKFDLSASSDVFKKIDEDPEPHMVYEQIIGNAEKALKYLNKLCQDEGIEMVIEIPLPFTYHESYPAFHARLVGRKECIDKAYEADQKDISRLITRIKG